MRENEENKEINRIDTDQNRQRLLAELTSHIGAPNAIGMGELYEIVFERPWSHRINDTRKVRRLITIMRREGVAICSTSGASDGGYYLAAAGSELAHYLRRSERRALLLLQRVAKIKRISLPNYLGQLQLNVEGGDYGDAA